MILNTHPNDRKEMVKAISELTGFEATYLYMPTCAYQIGPVTVNRNGSVTCDDEAMVETIRPMLIDRGWLDAEPKTEETLADSEVPVSVREMKLTMPIKGWTVSQMANLLRMVYGKQRLINRMLDSEMLYVGEAIITTISENPPKTPEDFEAKVQTAIETGRLKVSVHQHTQKSAEAENMTEQFCSAEFCVANRGNDIVKNSAQCMS